MTMKTFQKRVIALLNDNHSYVLKGDALEAWKDRQKEISAHQAELAHRDQEMMSHWFEQDAYVNGNWFRRLWLRIQYHLRDTRGAGRMPPIPDHIRIEIARCLLPDIIAFYESEEGQREFEEWKKYHKMHELEREINRESKD